MEAPNERSPMLSPPKTPIYTPAANNEVADLNIEKQTPEDSRRSWLRIKFCQVYFLLVLIAVLLFAVLIFCIVFATNFQNLNSKYENFMAQSKQFSQNFNQALVHSRSPAQENNDAKNDGPTREEYDEMDGLPPVIKPVKVVYGKLEAKDDPTQLSNATDKRAMREDPQAVPMGTPADLQRVMIANMLEQGRYVPAPSKERYTTPDPYRWYKEGGACGKMDQCQKSTFFKQIHHPLVVVSLDGFSKNYEDRKIIKNLEYFKECGSSAEYVIPSYPTKTFPNHYTIATGVYPGVHGLVDNQLYDPAVHSEILDAKFAKIPQIHGADPIWALYKRTTGRKTACMMWVGCGVEHDLKPDINVPFSFNKTDAEKFDEVVDWLALPEDQRPGLIMVYLAEPDDTGHWSHVDNPLQNRSLVEIDNLLGHFFNKLHDRGLLDCLNLIVMSDHGMADLYNHINIRTKIADLKVKVISGPSARLHLESSSTSQSDIRELFPCDDGTNYLLFNKTTMPPRYHYANHPRSGDILIEAPIGTEFRTDNKTERFGDHGYDYLESSMRTVFFARGPEFEKGKVVKPFQNIEYFNLFSELLGIPQQLVSPNNGTRGKLADAVLKKSGEQDLFYGSSYQIPECPKRPFQPPTATNCGDCPKPSLQCPQPSRNMASSKVASPNFCAKEACNMTVLERRNGTKLISIATIEMGFGSKASAACPYVREDLGETCPTHDGFSISLANSNYLATAVERGHGFNATEPLLVISGADWGNGSHPAYFYRILLSCGPADNWNMATRECVKPENSRVLSFLFPNMEEDWNCMAPRKRLLKYTARVKDIESLTGLRFFQNSLPYLQMIQRTTFVPMELW